MTVNPAESSDSKVIRIGIDDICPYICLDVDDKGIFIELVELILKPQGYQIEYQVIPWARSVKGLREGNFDLLLAVEKESFPSFVYPESAFLTDKECFFGRIDMNWRYEGIESLQGKRIGIMHYKPEDEGASLLNELLDSSHSLDISYFIPSAVNGGERIFRILAAGRVDLIPFPYFAADYYIELMGLQDQFTNYGCLKKEVSLWVALNPTGEGVNRLIKLLNEGINNLKDSGAYDALLEKYTK